MTRENGPGMYRVEPYYDFSRTPVELPTCMFKMASYHEQSGDNQNQVDPKLVELERRQERILQELKSLENEVATLAGRAKKASRVTVASNDKESVDLGSTIHDIVLYANPAQPPLSVVVLYEMLRLRYRCRSAVHVHSSVKAGTEGLLGFFGNGLEMSRSEAQLSLTLIWKDVSDGPVLMVAAPSQSPIHGEANVARYVARLLDAGRDRSDPAGAGAVDHWLDVASGPLRAASQRERTAGLRVLNGRLGKRDWLAGTATASVADAVCWGAVQGTGLAAGAPPNVQKWLKACAEQSTFKMASAHIA